jgi:hypothetical protein
MYLTLGLRVCEERRCVVLDCLVPGYCDTNGSLGLVSLKETAWTSRIVLQSCDVLQNRTCDGVFCGTLQETNDLRPNQGRCVHEGALELRQ